MTLREVLHAHIPVLSPTSTVRDAVDKMDTYQFPALVVVNDLREPLAVITEGDLCRASTSFGSLAAIGGESALRFATKHPVCVAADLEIGDAYHKMLASGLTLLPVVDEGNLMGVVLRVDLMQAMLMDAVPGTPE